MWHYLHSLVLLLADTSSDQSPPALSKNQQRKAREAEKERKEKEAHETRMALPAQATVIEKQNVVDDFYSMHWSDWRESEKWEWIWFGRE
jgi:hypothetical protein